MARNFAVVVVLAVSLWGEVCLADGEWETVTTGPITIKKRSVPNSPVKEVWAEGELSAQVSDVQEALMNVARFRFFMPYVKDARFLTEKLPDASSYVYTMVDFPIVGKRDYVLRTWLVEGVKPDGGGAFRNRWEAFPDYQPQRSEVVRVKVNSGSWVVTPMSGGAKSWAVYKFMVDPGGWIPAFAANLGNQQGVVATYRAVEQEALRLHGERLAAKRAASPGASALAR